MNERNLVICDREIRYANRLGENISKREELAVKVYVCSSVAKALELSKDKPIHMFVVDEGSSFEERKQIQATQVFVLSRGRVLDLGEDEYQVRKYQCADEIIREIFERYMDQTKENVTRDLRKMQAKIMAVYSPIHRLGKTTFAIAYGKECAKKRKVLYLNMEEYAGMQVRGGMNLGDLLYYMKQGNGNIGIRLQAAVQRLEQLDWIEPIPNVEDFKAISSQEWLELIEEVLKNSTYELVILDLGESIQGLWDILERCDRIYMPVLTDDISQRKLKQYEDTLEQLDHSRVERITHRFVMPERVEEYAKIRAKEEV